MSRLLDLLRASVRREKAWTETRIDETEREPAGSPGETRKPAHDFLATVPLPLAWTKQPERRL
ncbi:MAG: hypothetical protein JWP65_3561 [Ramlibacter sp.]|jgi:hypothetical protein|uniref:hypothetical protein n=1 Tax=Ramlibacter sp. TaxID=1917967 RepID=UPI00262D052F|nr:hypothetical protein [Ramlibacter sp.]MDB5753140.1 hypothetical protein [Ramlibacter sp.]